VVKVPYCRANNMQVEGWRVDTSCKGCPRLAWVCGVTLVNEKIVSVNNCPEDRAVELYGGC
jgi:hypothetical protein